MRQKHLYSSERDMKSSTNRSDTIFSSRSSSIDFLDTISKATNKKSRLLSDNLNINQSNFMSSPSSDASVKNRIPDALSLVSLSTPHRITDSAEQLRIKNAGYKIKEDRIEGMLAVTRAFGDFDFKMSKGKPNQQAVSVIPDIKVFPRNLCSDDEQLGVSMKEHDWTIIMACDGIFDTLPMKTISQLSYSCLYKNSQLNQMAFSEISQLRKYKQSSITHSMDFKLRHTANTIFDHCIAPEQNDEGLGTDNMSLLIIQPRSYVPSYFIN